VSRRLARGWLVGPVGSSGAPDRHGTRPASGRYAAHLFVVGLSRDYTIHNHLEEDTARANGHAVVVPSIDPAKLPALLPGAELLKEAVSRACLRVRLDRVATVLLAKPDRPEVLLPSVRSLHVAARHKPFRRLERSEAK
jgi:hypothetical protein